MKPYYEQDGQTIYHGDCREVLPEIGGGIDVIVTDPPFGIGMDKKNSHSSIRDNEKWPKSTWDETRPEKTVFDAILRICPDVAIWGGNFFADILPASSCWLAWIKPEAETGFSLSDMELCWTSRKNGCRVKTYARRDGNLHPTQKPLAIMTWTLHIMGGSFVLDPFMGSGTTLRAAKDLGMKGIGIETNERYCEIAANRLRQGVLFGT